MYEFIPYTDLATVVLDYTHEFWPLGVMLFGLAALSGGMIVLEAIRHHRSRPDRPEMATGPFPESYDTAA
jgi:hypothetical protein